MSDWWARHLGGGEQQPQPRYQPQYPGPQGYQQPQQQPYQPPQQQQVDTAQIPRGAVNVHNIIEMVQLWKGGAGNKEAESCPRCSGVMFRRKVGRMEAAPLCMNCGYNGLFEQAQGPG